MLLIQHCQIKVKKRAKQRECKMGREHERKNNSEYRKDKYIHEQTQLRRIKSLKGRLQWKIRQR